jgi:hypothetical protein
MNLKLMILLTIVWHGFALGTSAQAPYEFNYQSVVRDGNGQPVINKTIKVKISVHDGTAAGAVVYWEQRTVTTNEFGLFTIAIGSAAPQLSGGSLAAANRNNKKFLQVELSLSNDNNFIDAGTTQLLSVPYALQAANTSHIQGKEVDAALPSNGQVLKWNGNKWAASDDNGGNGSFSLPYNGTLNANSGTLFKINNPGTGNVFESNGTGGTAVSAFTTGNGMGLVASTVNGAGVYSVVNGYGTGVYGVSQTGLAGKFEVTNAASTADALHIVQKGKGRGLWMNMNTKDTSNGIEVSYKGTGAGIFSKASSSDGIAIYGQGSADGSYSLAGKFENVSGNDKPALQVLSQGHGYALEVNNYNVGPMAKGLKVRTGSNGGDAIYLESGSLRIRPAHDPADLDSINSSVLVYQSKVPPALVQLPYRPTGTIMIIVGVHTGLWVKTVSGDVNVPGGRAKMFIQAGEWPDGGWHAVE